MVRGIRLGVATVMLTVATALAGGGTAAAFTLDPSLSGSGIDRIPVGDRDIAGAGGVAQMADGRIVLAGYAKQGDRTLPVVERLTPSGDADPTFAATTSFPGTVFVDPAAPDTGPITQFSDVAVAADGSIWAAGEIVPDEDFGFERGRGFVAHILADGTPDPAFGNGVPGVRELGGRQMLRILVGPGGSIYALSQFGDSALPDGTLVTKLTAQGQVDTGYGTGGSARIATLGSGGDERTFAGDDMAIDAQGRVVVAGNAQSPNTFTAALTRFTSQGGLDTSFGGQGGLPGLELAFPDGQPAAKDPRKDEGLSRPLQNLTGVALAPDGRIVVSGVGQGAGARVGLVGRLTADGRLDGGFGTKGYTAVLAQTSADVRGHNHDTQFASVGFVDGHLVAVGTVNTLDTTASASRTAKNQLLIAGFTSAGKLDPSAASGGIEPGLFTTGIGGSAWPYPARAISAGSKLLVAGAAQTTTTFVNQLDQPSAMLLVRLGVGTAAGGGGGGTTGAGGCTTKTISVRAAKLTGCFTTKGAVDTAADGRVTMNGTRIDLLNGSRLVVDTASGTVRTATASGGAGVARVSVAAANGGVVVPLSKGPIDWTIHSGAGTRAALRDGPDACQPVGATAGTISTQGVGNLLGFPLPGTARVATAAGQTYVQVNVSLPKPAFVDATGCATLVTTDAGLQLDSLHVDVGAATIGPLTLARIALDYTGASDTWKGTLHTTLYLPNQVDLTGTISFAGGDFQSARIDAGFTPPFTILPPAIGLAGVHAGVSLRPTTISGGVHLVAGPQLLGTAALDADLNGTIAFPATGPAVTIDLGGTVRVVTIPVASSHVHFDSGGTFTVAGNASLLGLSVAVAGGVEGPHFYLEGDTSLDLFVGTLVARGIVSDVGAAICGGVETSVKDLTAGFAIRWSDLPLALPTPFTGCDLSPYKAFQVRSLAQPRRAGLRAAPPEQDFQVAAGTTALGLEVPGQGGAPLLDVVAPNGARIDGPAAATPGALDLTRDLIRSGAGTMVAYGQRAATYVLLTHPVPGTWRLVPHDGSPAIAAVRRSSVLPRPAVTARVTRAGARRTLSYRVAPLAGQSVAFVERARNVEHRLGDAAAGRAAGTLRFTPGEGAGGRRQIVALITQDGLPRASKVVATYVAPGPRAPETPAHVTVRRFGAGAVRASWKAVPGASRYVVRARLGDGHRTTQVVTRPSATFVAFASARGGSVSVLAVTRSGRQGRPAVGVLGRSRTGVRKPAAGPRPKRHCPPPGTAGSAACRAGHA